MTDNIVPIKPPVAIKEELAKCLRCKHEWVAVSEVGTRWLDCPACGENYGQAKGIISREGMHWECGCGGMLFQIDTTGPYCIECGEYADPR